MDSNSFNADTNNFDVDSNSFDVDTNNFDVDSNSFDSDLRISCVLALFVEHGLHCLLFFKRIQCEKSTSETVRVCLCVLFRRII